MNAGQFAKQRAKIEQRARKRPAWGRRAMAHLVREAFAMVILSGGQVVGWRMLDGSQVCAKRRYRDGDAANIDMARMQGMEFNRLPGAHVPLRAYACPFCKGWHLTSDPVPKFAANDNSAKRRA